MHTSRGCWGEAKTAKESWLEETRYITGQAVVGLAFQAMCLRLIADRFNSMASTAPGSKLVYEVTVKEGGQVLLSWLNSKFYNLGEACVTLDEVGPNVRIDGHWR